MTGETSQAFGSYQNEVEDRVVKNLKQISAWSDGYEKKIFDTATSWFDAVLDHMQAEYDNNGFSAWVSFALPATDDETEIKPETQYFGIRVTSLQDEGSQGAGTAGATNYHDAVFPIIKRNLRKILSFRGRVSRDLESIQNFGKAADGTPPSDFSIKDEAALTHTPIILGYVNAASAKAALITATEDVGELASQCVTATKIAFDKFSPNVNNKVMMGIKDEPVWRTKMGSVGEKIPAGFEGPVTILKETKDKSTEKTSVEDLPPLEEVVVSEEDKDVENIDVENIKGELMSSSESVEDTVQKKIVKGSLEILPDEETKSKGGSTGKANEG
eukprot:Platyproteum_vivax@DN3189_c0_g1_i1.p1